MADSAQIAVGNNSSSLCDSVPVSAIWSQSLYWRCHWIKDYEKIKPLIQRGLVNWGLLVWILIPCWKFQHKIKCIINNMQGCKKTIYLHFKPCNPVYKWQFMYSLLCKKYSFNSRAFSVKTNRVVNCRVMWVCKYR